jgi:hypothetical protein
MNNAKPSVKGASSEGSDAFIFHSVTKADLEYKESFNSRCLYLPQSGLYSNFNALNSLRNSRKM